ncbi:hypothetical protein [Bacillus massilinigeriensis]|nr:hypothetical protein [Bacillus mediterraneensis]
MNLCVTGECTWNGGILAGSKKLENSGNRKMIACVFCKRSGGNYSTKNL